VEAGWGGVGRIHPQPALEPRVFRAQPDVLGFQRGDPNAELVDDLRLLHDQGGKLVTRRALIPWSPKVIIPRRRSRTTNDLTSYAQIIVKSGRQAGLQDSEKPKTVLMPCSDHHTCCTTP